VRSTSRAWRASLTRKALGGPPVAQPSSVIQTAGRDRGRLSAHERPPRLPARRPCPARTGSTASVSNAPLVITALSLPAVALAIRWARRDRRSSRARAARRRRRARLHPAGAFRPLGCCTPARCPRSSRRTSSRRPNCATRAKPAPCWPGPARASRSPGGGVCVYLLVDPTCTVTRERPTKPSAVGTPLYVSRRLVVLRV
jgi:hypothetical protein